ncbi:Protein kinase-like domain [Scedosporium apiospermum]|uniref:Protein kinase-like domain n=1 Tax=Pseudallescheria apiosperma TaxID=563466 RepID=A0A084FWQ2_PSEDA|nr:Protein kinase-like domain [Scedosporium apiospermum]KEZ39514.1 Protein kinase-like domain [Scedosporium apiospermum]
MTDDSAPTSALGSDTWLGANEYESGSALHTRATNFLSTAKWDVLADIASKHRGGMSCQYEDKFSVGHFNMVRRIVFEDGVNWVARVRLPNENMFAGREELEDSKTMEIEVASMKFFRRETSIPVPEVFDYNTSRENDAGAPYILMEYIHGNVALELRQAKSCAPQLFGTPEQDRKFREQMAQIQATAASFKFPQIGSLYYNKETDDFYIGPEPQTGKGPWASSTEYYDDLVNHLLKGTIKKDDLKQNQSFMVPTILNHLMRLYGEEKTGPFRLTNRYFGAHNILVNDDFDIIGLIDFDGVMSAPLEVVAQYPELSFLQVDPPGITYSHPAAIERVKLTAPRLEEYKRLLGTFESRGGDVTQEVAGHLGSTSASIYQGMQAFAQHQDFVNEKWMKSCLKMLQEYAESL